MNLNKEELKIINIFRKNLFAELTLQEIMKILKKKSYNWTFNTIKKLSETLLIMQKKGKTNFIKLNLKNKLTIAALEFLDKKEISEKKIPIIDELIASISKKTVFFILLVFGSYAIGKNQKGSDIDIAIITENSRTKKEIKPYIKEVTRLSTIPADVYTFTQKEFKKMLLNDEENLGKQIFRKHCLAYGNEAYYNIIDEAIKNGLSFKI
ncbi:hypothetical protein DRJ22_03170 [Candidatus Woesearchaeota archaeon]|nr:MAG: hypothetical protein B6U93_01180 [Candidatus Woesearchaeota archaeon ex4484_78]RLE45966.1 MAG: hypothetical protein DRJ22_03170 [Candidatus Woesearchaeota archaeon]